MEWLVILKKLGLEKEPQDFQTCDLLGKEFDSSEELETFYSIYSKYMGLSTHNDDIKKVSGIITMHRWVCSREGFQRDKYLELDN